MLVGAPLLKKHSVKHSESNLIHRLGFIDTLVTHPNTKLFSQSFLSWVRHGFKRPQLEIKQKENASLEKIVLIFSKIDQIGEYEYLTLILIWFS